MKLISALTTPALTSAASYHSTDKSTNGYLMAPNYPGRCPDVSTSKDYDFQKSLGLWWNVAISPFFWHFKGSQCVSVDIEDISGQRPGYVKIQGNAVTQNGKRTVTGLGIYDDYGPNSGIWSVSYFMEPNHNQDNWVVLDTDNDSYAYVWDCSEKKASKLSAAFGGEDTHSGVIWINVRDRNMSDEDIEAHIERFNNLMETKFGWEYAQQFGETIFKIDTSDETCAN